MNTHTRRSAAIIGLPLLLVSTLANSSTVPVVNAGPDQTVYLGESVTLNGTATGDPGVWLWDVVSSPTGSNWNLFDADTSDAIFSSDTIGDYLVTFEAWNFYGWSDPDQVAVTVIENLDPVAVAFALPTSGVSPLTVNFDGSESYDPLGDALLYDWTFGDGQFGSGALTTHTYESPGTYYPTLIVLDELGAAGFVNLDPITVSAVPVPPAVWLFSSGLLGLIGIARKKAT